MAATRPISECPNPWVGRVHPSQMLKVLVAEDDQAQRDALVSMMIGLDVPVFVFEAKNGREAARMGSNLGFHVIFMDLDMPELDGDTATRAIRGSGCTAKIIGMVDDDVMFDNARVTAFLDSGINECFSLPISSTDLRRILVNAYYWF